VLKAKRDQPVRLELRVLKGKQAQRVLLELRVLKAQLVPKAQLVKQDQLELQVSKAKPVSVDKRDQLARQVQVQLDQQDQQVME
jgi:hypothetical protein